MALIYGITLGREIRPTNNPVHGRKTLAKSNQGLANRLWGAMQTVAPPTVEGETFYRDTLSDAQTWIAPEEQ